MLLEADETALSHWRNFYLQGAMMQPEQRIPIFPGLQGDESCYSAGGGEEGRSCCVWHHVCVCEAVHGWGTKHSYLTKLLSCWLFGRGMWCCRALWCVFLVLSGQTCQENNAFCTQELVIIVTNCLKSTTTKERFSNCFILSMNIDTHCPNTSWLINVLWVWSSLIRPTVWLCIQQFRM